MNKQKPLDEKIISETIGDWLEVKDVRDAVNELKEKINIRKKVIRTPHYTAYSKWNKNMQELIDQIDKIFGKLAEEDLKNDYQNT